MSNKRKYCYQTIKSIWLDPVTNDRPGFADWQIRCQCCHGYVEYSLLIGGETAHLPPLIQNRRRCSDFHGKSKIFHALNVRIVFTHQINWNSPFNWEEWITKAFWRIVKPIEAYWSLLKPIDAYWSLLKPIEAYWSLLKLIEA